MTADARVWFPISAGLLTWEHYQRLGPAWMVFEWMIHEQRAPKNGEENTGTVRNGDPISYEGIGECLHGMPARTVERHIALLESKGYIRSEYIRGHGKRYTVANPIRWSMVLRRNGESNKPDSAEVRSTHSAEMGSSTPQECGAVLPINGEANKEQEPRTKNKIKSECARPTLEQVRAYCKERNNGVDPQKWFDHYSANGWKVGRNPMKDWEAAVRTWENNGVNKNENRAQQRQADNLAAAAEAKRDFGLVS
jgi:hypothetical protein